MIDDLTAPQMRELLTKVAGRFPSLVLDLSVDVTMVGAAEPDPGPPGPEPALAERLSWCVCTRCRDMPTDEEKLCCGKTPQNCTSTLPVSSPGLLQAQHTQIQCQIAKKMQFTLQECKITYPTHFAVTNKLRISTKRVTLDASCGVLSAGTFPRMTSWLAVAHLSPLCLFSDCTVIYQ